jgi:formylglycine-generating enzyme required for sulfatase activity
MKTSLAGRADLLEALLAGGPELQAAVARLLGMERLPPEPVELRLELPPAAAPVPGPPPVLPVVEPAEVPFWRAESCTQIEPAELKPVKSPVPGPQDASRPQPAPLGFRPLASPAAVLTKLRRVSSFARTSSELDVARVVDHLSQGRFPDVLPRLVRKTWGPSIHVVVDHHVHLAPYREDQDAVLQTLGRVYPRDGVQVADLRDGAALPHRRGTPRAAAYQPPGPGATVLALSDLGALAVDRTQPRATWRALGRVYRERGARPVALVPCDAGSIPLEATRDWVVIPWESQVASRTSGLAPDQVGPVCRRLLTLLSYALRLEPKLIREVRRLLVKGRRGAGVEARVWQDAALRGRHFEAAEFHPAEALTLQHDFAREAPDLRREVIALLERCRAGRFPAVWFLERLALEAEAARLGLPDADLDAAVRWAAQQRNLLRAGAGAGKRDPTSGESLWFRRAFLRLPQEPLEGSAGDALHEIWAYTNAPEDRPPAGLDPARVPALDQPIRTLELRHAGDCLVARTFAGSSTSTILSGSLVGLIRTRNGLLQLEPVDDFWSGGVPPAWADSWGWDPSGAWVVLRLGNVTQRLRWIPPGTFWMGSPEDEEGRYPDEGPRHKEAIKSGYWMFDTPCTQALWQAVMGENPSDFQGGDRPVENVSWDECQAFIQQLNERFDGLGLALPSEAQWEYACRAGTETPRYREELDEIAWYRGNSDEQTHPVAQKAPNGWGLYDMLGNVWEWCADAWRSDYTERSGKGASAQASPHRVIRGGSWDFDPQDVRAACRYRSVPTYRVDYLGFRCAEFRTPGPAGRSRDAEQAGRESAHGAEHRSDRAPASGAARLRPGARPEESDSVPISVLTPLRVRTDLETLTIRPITLPPWATAIGRDRYGLWAEFTIDPPPPKKPWGRGLGKVLGRRPRAPALAPAPVRQRLRWIPPGRFLMGLPEDEEVRLSWEGPRHQQKIDSGFWMFDTPCTQALWEAVMGAGTNPSRFQGVDRPVERVTWNDCQRFLTELNKRLDGLDLSLPSEAQWEYACRAGTETARYHEDLDGIAWYAGNSGGETHAVKGKSPNGWGLCDMLGNVWEWCMDPWTDDNTLRGAGTAAEPASAHRVIRGGSWSYVPQGVRAACRAHNGPTNRYGYLGFRCAEFRSGS